MFLGDRDVSLSLVTGLVSPVADGHVIQNKTVPGLAEGRPSTLAGRVVLGRSRYSGAWWQENHLMGGLQVYGRSLSTEEMVSSCSVTHVI